MKIKRQSGFKNPTKDQAYFRDWVAQLEAANQRKYESILLNTSLGKTQVWKHNTAASPQHHLVIFPGARTTALFWDFDQGLNHLQLPLNIWMVETNGLPNLSDGNTPDIRSLDFGHWAVEVLNGLGIDQAFVAGASFGGLVSTKLGIVAPEKCRTIFLLNPGCLQPFSMGFKNLYYNLLPVISPSEKNVVKFLDAAVWHKPNHALSATAEKLLIDYEVFALKRYRDKTQKPYYLKQELTQVNVPTYLLLGNQDLLFPYQKSKANAQKYLPHLKDIQVYEGVGHGIETYAGAMQYIERVMAQLIE